MVRPGQTIKVVVAAEAAISDVIIFTEEPLPDSKGKTKPPFTFSIKVPRKGIDPRKYSLTAAGVTTSGKAADSDPIDIDVERADQPVSLRVEPPFLDVYLGDLGGISHLLQVIGTYADHSELSLTDSTQTTFVSQDPRVATVNQSGEVMAVSAGATKIVVNGKVAVDVKVRPPFR